MAKIPANIEESINGRLLQFFGVWKIQSGYGTFPLSLELQKTVDESSNGAWVAGWVKHGTVNQFHFENESLDAN
mgnify:CR=1 FL=1